MKKVLIIEDDMIIAGKIKDHLNSWGFETKCVEDFFDIYKTIDDFSPHLILLDINLPSKNGYVICSEIRKISKTPIIFMSSGSDDMNIIMAMNMGGDDFIGKPFSLEVLTAKINSLLRRTYDFNVDLNEIKIGGLTLDIENARVRYNGNNEILTKNEFIILKVLMQNKGKIVSRDILIERLWEDESFVDDNTLTVNITRLRKKLMKIGIIDFINTRKSMGYIVDEIY